MKEIRKPVHGGSRERAVVETEAFAGASFPTEDFNTAVGSRQVAICGILQIGQANALSARELSKVTGWTEREVTRAIEAARLSGNPVCACRWGYFLPETPDDLRCYARAFDRRLRHIKNTRAALEDMIIEASGQTTLEGVD